MLVSAVQQCGSGRWAWQPTPVFLPGESPGQRSLVGGSPWGGKESGTTERLTLTYLHKYLQGGYMSRICLKIIQSGDKGGGGDTDK